MRALHVDGTQRLLTAAAGKVGHWVQLSSDGVYGLYREGGVTEDTPLNPQGEYEVTKSESDLLLQNNAVPIGLSYTILRPSYVYGPMMPNQSLFKLIEMIERRLFFYIGPKGATANNIFVENVVDALILCGKDARARGRIYNLSDHDTLENYIGMISDALGKPRPSIRLPLKPISVLSKALGWMPGFPLTSSRVEALTNRSVYGTIRIAKELGYTHSTSMKDGIKETVRFWREQR